VAKKLTKIKPKQIFLEKTNMPQRTRYQAAIMRDEEILMIKHQEHENGHAYWVLPGGGIEDGETEIQCVHREVQEETNLEVKVIELLLDEPPQHEEKGVYQRFKTYLCHPITIQASPGYEPEPEAAAKYAITDVGWYNVNDETTWNQLIVNDPITAPGLRRIRAALKLRELRAEKEDLRVDEA
jgi:ADP-ribose pyrophosphatase YjhB (NUDIX family)